MANRNTYVPTTTRVRARRIKKLYKAIMAVYNSMNWGEELGSKEDQAKVRILDDRQWVENKIDIDWLNSVGDNNSTNWEGDMDKLKELEVKYLTSAKEALKGL